MVITSSYPSQKLSLCFQCLLPNSTSYHVSWQYHQYWKTHFYYFDSFEKENNTPEVKDAEDA